MIPNLRLSRQTLWRSRIVRRLAACWLLGVSGSDVSGASFSNLDFEAGASHTSSFDPSQIYSDVLPFWTPRFNGVVQPGASFNNFILDYQTVAVMSVSGFLGPNYVLQGSRSAFLLSAASVGDPSSAVNASITQTGMVPFGAVSLVFDTRNQWHESFPIPPGPFSVTLGGVSLDLVPLTQNAGDVTYGADISGWAGQTTELSIGVLASPAWGGANWEGWAVLDSIRFLSTPIPEPAAGALVCLGALACVARRRA